MPKYKIKTYGEEIRVIKGKQETKMNLDILEQCEDEEESLSGGEELQEKTDENPEKIIDPRTYEEIMCDTFNKFNSKSSQVRCNGLQVICDQMQSTYKPKFLMKHKETLLNIIENSLRSNVPLEVESAAKLLSLAAIQLPQSDKSLKTFSRNLCVALKQPNLNCPTLCYAIGVLTFLYEDSGSKISTVIDQLIDIITAKSIINETLRNATYEFRVAALETWLFLTTLLPSEGSLKRSSNFGYISKLLECEHFNLRVACAKAIAITLECGHEMDKIFVKRNSRKIIQSISWMANARNKNVQGIKTAWDVLQYLEKGVTPHREIRIGKSTLALNTWTLNIQYDMLCNVIGSANVTKHLSRNTKLLTKIEVVNSTKNLTSSACTKDPPIDTEDLTSSTNEDYVYVPSPVQQKQYNFDSLSKSFGNATHESVIVRTKALDDICKELQLNHVPNSFLENHIDVVLEIVIRTMKRGNETAEILAIRLATLMVLQLGYNERFCSKLYNSFTNSIRLAATTPSVNAAICMTLAFFELVDDEQHSNDALETMDLLRNIFSGNQPHSKTFSGAATNDESNFLCCKAVEAWGLLLTSCSPKDICTPAISRIMKELAEMMHTPNVELRVACGQVICLIIEQGRIYDNSYHQSDIVEVLNSIKNIVSDRCRNISKDKLRTQNTKFRDILKYLENGSPLSFQLKFAEEIHELKTWSSVLKYQKLCEFIGPGLTTHLVQNDRLRDIIAIGPKPGIGPFDYSQSVQHKLVSAAKKKSKTQENRLNLRRPKFECI